MLIFVSILLVILNDFTDSYTQNDEIRENRHKDEFHHNPNSFVYNYKQYRAVCSNPTHNKVLPRYDNHGDDNLPTEREWSLNSDVMFDFLNINGSTLEIKPAKLPFCKSTEETIQSVANLVTNYDCQVSWYSSTQICHVIHQYSLVWWYGDSLTRHMMQGLLLLLKGDWRIGGHPLLQNIKIYEQCACDGQFSENLLCRESMKFDSSDSLVLDTKFVIKDFMEWGLCSNYIPLDNQYTKFVWMQNNYHQISEEGCPINNNKPIFIFMQYALHCSLNVDQCIPIIDDLMIDYARRFYDCYHQIRFIYAGGTASSEAIVRNYPNQEDSFVINFNEEMKNWFHENYPFVLVLDFFNLTWESRNRSSDGVHHLSDVNFIKVTAVLNAMHHMALETMDNVNVSTYFPDISSYSKSTPSKASIPNNKNNKKKPSLGYLDKIKNALNLDKKKPNKKKSPSS